MLAHQRFVGNGRLYDWRLCQNILHRLPKTVVSDYYSDVADGAPHTGTVSISPRQA